MSHALSIDVFCAAGAGNLAATVALDDGTEHEVVLVEGQLERDFAARPIRLTISTALADAGQAGAVGSRQRAADAIAVDADAIFDRPLDIPASGRLAYEIVWECECHGELHVPAPDGKFGSYEHIQCAYWVGRDGIGDDAAQLPAPVELAFETPLQLPNRTVTFGEIICLAGDFFAHLDDESAARFPGAWPKINGLAGWLAGSDYAKQVLVAASGNDIKELLATIHRDGASSPSALAEVFHVAADTAVNHYPARRYLALASQNYCHFGSPDPRIKNEALALYRGYHQLACERAAAAGTDKARWIMAVATEAFACHFLTDLFASGHMRTPRRALGERFGILRGSLKMSKTMHDEDNVVGLWVTTTAPPAAKRVVWRAFGDGRLLTPEAKPHLRQVQEAVRRSVWEIHEANAKRAVPADQRAEGLIPVPLAPGKAPLATDVMPDGTPHAAGAPPNHAPMFALLANGHVGKRLGSSDSRKYLDLEVRGEQIVDAFA